MCLGAIVTSGVSVHAQDKVDKLEKENQLLKQRLDALEAAAKKEGVVSSALPVKAMSDISISGFVQSSYFFNTQQPKDGLSDAYLWNTTHNSFSLNKVKVTIASKPVEKSGDTWGAGFRTSLMWGEDTGALNTSSGIAAGQAIREAFVEANIPVGTGLNFKAGQLISLLNYESGDGGAANANFSQGNQWWYTGNGPNAGVQLGYSLTDWLDLTVRVENGLYAGSVDSNGAKLVMGSLAFKPMDKLWFNLIGFGPLGGPTAGNDGVMGGSLLAGYKVTDPFSVGFEGDYFVFQKAPNALPKDSVLWSIGTWLTYDFSPKFGVALRGDYLKAEDGVGFGGPIGGHVIGTPPTATSQLGGLAGTTGSGDLSSLTLTLNFKPTPSIKFQPEIRYDHTSYTGGLDGKKDRVIVGAGVTYSF
jgi:hypothetical protein